MDTNRIPGSQKKTLEERQSRYKVFSENFIFLCFAVGLHRRDIEKKNDTLMTTNCILLDINIPKNFTQSRPRLSDDVTSQYMHK